MRQVRLESVSQGSLGTCVKHTLLGLFCWFFFLRYIHRSNCMIDFHVWLFKRRGLAPGNVFWDLYYEENSRRLSLQQSFQYMLTIEKWENRKVELLCERWNTDEKFRGPTTQNRGQWIEWWYNFSLACSLQRPTSLRHHYKKRSKGRKHWR